MQNAKWEESASFREDTRTVNHASVGRTGFNPGLDMMGWVLMVKVGQGNKMV